MAVSNGYASRVQLQKALKGNADNAAYDDWLDTCITRASRKIDEITGGVFYSVGVTSQMFDVFAESDSGIYVEQMNLQKMVFPGPIISITSIYEDNYLLTEGDDYFIYSGPGYVLRDGCWTTNYKSTTYDNGIIVTATFGYATGSYPDDINRICIEIAKIFSGLDTRLITAEGQEINAQMSTAIIPRTILRDLAGWSRKHV